jgi:TolB-like protein/Tfp pilus assembly protein PilF
VNQSIIVGIVAALLLIGVVGISAYFLTRGGKPADLGNQPETTHASDAIAVLPFENVGGDPKTEYLSDGVADHLINSFSQVRRPDLKVRPFTSVARYKRQRPDALTMGRELNAKLIIMGTLHLRGDDLSIGVSLVDARDDNQLWGDRYQGKLGGILALQDQIARDVAAKLRLGLTGEEEQRLTKRYTADPEAYLLFREGVFHLSKFTPEGIQTAIEYYHRALKKDPNYALAYAGLGRCYLLLGAIHVGPLQTHAEAKKYLTKALSIDNSLEFAHSGLGLIAMFRDWDWPDAERELREGFAHDSTAPAENQYGFYLAAMGRPGDALVYIRRAEEANPSAQRRSELAMCYNWMGQYDQAVVEARKALELDPKFPVAYAELGTALVQQGKSEEAIAEMQKAFDRGQKHPLLDGIRGYAYAMAGKNAEAHRVLDDLKGPSKGRFGIAFSITRIHAALGEKDEAFEWLRKSCDERESWVIWIKVDPTLQSLRSDPQFARVLKEMRLPP